MNTSRLQLEEYKKGILEGDRVVLARAITLIESTLAEDQRLAGEVLDAVIARSGNSLRIGITGSPGVGKSTFIETFGKVLIGGGKRVAVITIDPSSTVTGGSILGDKTRMQELAKDRDAFIRPSPSGPTLGGVAPYTREAMLLCEAAGFDIVIVETVGTGQSEVSVRKMVDFFLLLVQPGAGDELQGIKKGIVEMADAIAVTKADGNNLNSARQTQADFQHALHLLKAQPSGWVPSVLICSSLLNTGLAEIRDTIEHFQKDLTASGHFDRNRAAQRIDWFRDHFHYRLSVDPLRYTEVRQTEEKLQDQIRSGQLSPRHAAERLMLSYHEAVIKAGRP